MPPDENVPGSHWFAPAVYGDCAVTTWPAFHRAHTSRLRVRGGLARRRCDAVRSVRDEAVVADARRDLKASLVRAARDAVAERRLRLARGRVLRRDVSAARHVAARVHAAVGRARVVTAAAREKKHRSEDDDLHPRRLPRECGLRRLTELRRVVAAPLSCYLRRRRWVREHVPSHRHHFPRDRRVRQHAATTTARTRRRQRRDDERRQPVRRRRHRRRATASERRLCYAPVDMYIMHGPLRQHGHRLQHRRHDDELEVVPRDQRALGLLQLDERDGQRGRAAILPASTNHHDHDAARPARRTTRPRCRRDAVLHDAPDERRSTRSSTRRPINDRRRHADRSRDPRAHQVHRRAIAAAAASRSASSSPTAIPNGCDENLDDLSNLLQAHYTATTIRTYVIGMTGATTRTSSRSRKAETRRSTRRPSARSRTRAERATRPAVTGTSATATRKPSSPRSPRSKNRPTAAPTAAARQSELMRANLSAARSRSPRRRAR